KDIQTINDIKENHKFSLKDFLIRSDRIKFAKTNPIDRDIEKDNKLIEDVLDNSKPCPDIKDV
ncbi:MAG: hypothetical protein SV062_10265, partial [Thermodesulfobacteriota bacterium]|nr:hypothetical protein [Thermodesulfobacteriota bacterium]